MPRGKKASAKTTYPPFFTAQRALIHQSLAWFRGLVLKRRNEELLYFRASIFAPENMALWN